MTYIKMCNACEMRNLGYCMNRYILTRHLKILFF